MAAAEWELSYHCKVHFEQWVILVLQLKVSAGEMFLTAIQSLPLS